MAVLHGLPPVVTPDSRVLILGSMPGAASLQAQRYYAHAQNLFWPFMQELFGIAYTAPYVQRIDELRRRRIAVWDVIAACIRPGSLDADIRDERVNDFVTFFAQHTQIGAVFLNGRKAETSFRKLVAPRLGERLAILQVIGLPSTSPAHAAMRRADKLRAWRAIPDYLMEHSKP